MHAYKMFYAKLLLHIYISEKRVSQRAFILGSRFVYVQKYSMKGTQPMPPYLLRKICMCVHNLYMRASGVVYKESKTLRANIENFAWRYELESGAARWRILTRSW